MQNNIQKIDTLVQTRDLPDEALTDLLTTLTPDDEEYLYAMARAVREAHYGKDVYLRGLIEFTNVCKNDCYYCGIRKSNAKADRYRLSLAEILDCCDKGYKLGFRTFVLQGGEDAYYTDDMLCELIAKIHHKYPDCAITLSIGEKERDSYQAYFDAGAERYLLRHETADPAHYRKLHPDNLSCEHRKNCLYTLKDIGYQVGAGMMIGSPYQTTAELVADLRFLQKLSPEMVGIGPFIAHQDTPFAHFANGTLTDTLHLLAIIRLMMPDVLLPATTALGTIHPLGREKGVLAGANVVMPNLSPRGVRKKYMLYDGKICTEDEAVTCQRCMHLRMERIGYHVEADRGDHPAFRK